MEQETFEKKTVFLPLEEKISFVFSAYAYFTRANQAIVIQKKQGRKNTREMGITVVVAIVVVKSESP